MVDAAPDELIIQKQEEEKKRKEEEKKKKEEEKKKKEEEEKKKKEEEEKKKEEEQKKKDEEERKHLDDANKEEERKKSEEAQKLDDAKKAENGDNKEENSKKSEDTSTDGKAKEAEVLNTSDFDKSDKKKDESKQLDAANSDKNIPEDKNENSKEVWSASHFNPEDSKQELTKDSLSGNQSDSEQSAIEAAEGVPSRVGKRDLVSRSKEFPSESDIPDLTQEEITLLMQDSDYEVRGMSVDAEEDIEEEIIYDPDYFDPEKRSVKSPDKFCLNNSQVPLDLEDGNTVYPGFNIWDVGDRLTEEKAILAGKSYLYTYAPPPSMIIFLTQDGSYNVSTSPKKSKLLDNGLAESFVQSSKSTHMNVLSEFKSLQDEVPPNKHRVISSYHVDLPEDDFIYDHKQIIATLEAKGSSRSPQEQSYLQSLYYSVHSVANGGPPKYFSEARLLGTHLGDHYDWRFFDGLLNGRYEQSLILHRLIRTWLSFTRKNGITTWVAHGSLLSWYWNGMAFPWDYDIDVQVPVQDLHKLSLEYNQTLIVEDAEDGFGRYFLDCGTFITLRERGNGNNNIDARFIDVDSGLYIDITGLAVSNTPAPSRYDHKLPKDYKPTKDDDHVGKNLALKVYNCRNMHFSSLDEISPLIKTSIEGEIGYVPKKYSEMLATEYKFGFVNKRFDGHAFLPQLRLWLKEDDLYYFYHNQTEWIKYNRFNENFLIKGGYEDYSYAYTEEEKKKLKSKKLTLTDKELEELYNMPTKDLALLLMKDEIFMEFYSSKDFTYYHEDEIMRLLFGKSTSKLIHDAPDFKPMKFDPFMFKMQSEYLTFESEIERYGLLSSKSHNKAP